MRFVLIYAQFYWKIYNRESAAAGIDAMSMESPTNLSRCRNIKIFLSIYFWPANRYILQSNNNLAEISHYQQLVSHLFCSFAFFFFLLVYEGQATDSQFFVEICYWITLFCECEFLFKYQSLNHKEPKQSPATEEKKNVEKIGTTAYRIVSKCTRPSWAVTLWMVSSKHRVAFYY